MFLCGTCIQSRYLVIPVKVLLLMFLALSPETARAIIVPKVTARNGVVATDEGLCSQVGRDVLQRGGNAIDAAVAATLCLGVVCPSYSGIGGGGFMLIQSGNGKKAKVIDMREMAPGRASKDMFDVDHTKNGPLSIAVPGQIAGLYTAHKNYGTVPWSSLVRPAEYLARTGFTISPGLFRSISSSRTFIMADKELRSIFAPNGTLLSQGQTIRLRKLADTLTEISKHGMDIFYNGSIAKSLANDIQKLGGIITKEDFKKYRVIIREPLVANAMGYKVVTTPPPASGGAVLILILKILSNYKATSVPITQGVHRFIEALKYALSLRTNLGDPEFVNVTSVVKKMTSTSHAKKLQKLISDKRTFEPAHYGSKWSQIYDHGTTHVCVVDSARNVVSMTISLNSYFGSKIVSPSTGIFLNNQMFDFSVPRATTPPPSPANFIQPYKRPLSSMAPAIFWKGKKVKMVIGAAGGLLIPDAVAQVILYYITTKNASFAVIRPRFYHMLYPNVLYHEEYITPDGIMGAIEPRLLNEMRMKGHVVQKCPGWMTICQFVVQKLKGPNSGQLIAISDIRKGGWPAGH